MLYISQIQFGPFQFSWHPLQDQDLSQQIDEFDELNLADSKLGSRKLSMTLSLGWLNENSKPKTMFLYHGRKKVGFRFQFQTNPMSLKCQRLFWVLGIN